MALILTPQAEAFIDEWTNPLPYVVAHTSGSTGTPKEIRLLKSDMRASARATIDFFRLSPQSTLYLPLSPDYIAGKMQIVRALEASCSLIVEDPSNRPTLQAISDGTEIDLLPIVPSQSEAILTSPYRRQIKNMIIGGAPLPAETETLIHDDGLTAYATYGMTETCSHVALRRLGEEAFTALPGFTFSLDQRGCLTIGSRTLSFGSLVTNDMVSLISDRSFRWLGRYDNVINSGGIKIFPEELEKLIAPLFPTSSLFYVTSRPSAKWGEEAVIVTDSTSLPSDILDRIRTLVDHRKAPKAIIFEPEIKLTQSRKIIRHKFFS